MSDVRAENEEGKKGGGYLKRVEIKLQIFLRRSRKRGFWRGKREIGGDSGEATERLGRG